jgi:hypothetical protein
MSTPPITRSEVERESGSPVIRIPGVVGIRITVIIRVSVVGTVIRRRWRRCRGVLLGRVILLRLPAVIGLIVFVWLHEMESLWRIHG